MNIEVKKKHYIRLIFLILVFIPELRWAASIELGIKPGSGVTQEKRLSEYFSGLKNSNFDTPVFIMDSGKPGSNALVIGGTHGNELAGHVSAMLIVENARVEAGKLVVIPFANRSALSISDSFSHVRHTHTIQGRSSPRTLFYGNRFSNLNDDQTSRYNFDKRATNLNRIYPGKKDGNRTEQLGFAIMELIRVEKIDFNIDFHEARTKKKKKSQHNLAYTLISHPRGLEIAAFALLEMEEKTGISLKLEEAKSSYEGFSHWEIGHHTTSISFLSESPNPGQDKGRRKPDVLNDKRYPLKHRVGMHIWLFYFLAESYAEDMDKPFKISGLPEYDKLMTLGVGNFLN